MDDPEHIKIKEKGKKSISQLDFDTIKKILIETKTLYFLTLTDKDKAIKSMENDELYMELRNEAKEKSINENVEFDDNDFKKNIDNIIKEFNKIKDENMSKGTLMEKRKQVTEIATERLEVMGIALKEFMEGYREGKDLSLKSTLQDKSLDAYIDGITNSDQNNNNDQNTNNDKKSEGN